MLCKYVGAYAASNRRERCILLISHVTFRREGEAAEIVVVSGVLQEETERIATSACGACRLHLHATVAGILEGTWWG